MISLPPLSRRRTALALLSASAALAAGLPSAQASAATAAEGQPTAILRCGAYRDFPSEWTAVKDAGWCTTHNRGTWDYSWILTGPSNVHYATWDFTPGYYTKVPLQLDVYVPANTGADAEYDYQVCGSGTWQPIGTINQYNASGWTTTGAPVPAYTDICYVRVHNIGSASWNLGEDALGFN